MTYNWNKFFKTNIKCKLHVNVAFIYTLMYNYGINAGGLYERQAKSYNN